jgi:hypothetical protein
VSTFIDQPRRPGARPNLQRTSPNRALSRPRLVMLEDDTDLVTLLCDVVGDEFALVPVSRDATIATIDAMEPDVILIGAWVGESSTALAPTDIASLATRHMRLDRVPIVVLTADVRLLGGSRLADLGGATLMSLPVDLETFRSVLTSVSRRATPAAAMSLPELCAHGFEIAAEYCRQCSPTPAMLRP